MPDDVSTLPGNGKRPHPIAILQEEITGTRMTEQLRMALPEHITVEKFQRVVVTAVNKNPDLVAGNRNSLFTACVECAQDGLLPNGKEAALVIYNTKTKVDGRDVWVKKVQYLPMIAGIHKKARNSGDVQILAAHLIHDNDEFSYSYGFEPDVIHKPLLGDRGPIIGVYAVAKLANGDKDLEVMSVSDVDVVRAASKNPEKGPWKNWWGEMARKTVVRRLSKRLPLSPDLEKMIQRQDDLYALEGPTVEHEGPRLPPPPRPTRAEFETYPISDEAGEIVDDLSIHDWPVMFGRQLEACIAEQADVAALMQANAATLDKLRAAGANLEPLYTIYHAWRDDHPLEDEDEIAGAASSDAGDPGSGRTALDDAQASGEPVRPSPGSEAAKPGTAASTASDETEPLIPVGITEEGDADWAGWTKLFTERLEGIDSLGWLESFLAVHEKSLGNLKIAKPTWAEKMDGMIAGAQERLSA